MKDSHATVVTKYFAKITNLFLQCGCSRGAGAGPAGTAAAGPMLEAKLMNLIKGWLQKF